eukprot:CAMPEP_0172555962 /NCGR_PEP_ID=MMETSP1067-20121228/61988_1 /TAXON_ID=265564 ORGANISM="Thalassiosira punctigera, Strain Tpunct2005C2" /NCGR_SAMPLE_ID=MMETSP1067 /ASSEMBLY_ACC=CAM_ASM_000444 /LENGTH=53 /DNA_ID=CAMNT_0013344613 /DNA_START=144 /DNA_END=301 /DNA_ORIENTATION=-
MTARRPPPAPSSSLSSLLFRFLATRLPPHDRSDRGVVISSSSSRRACADDGCR